MRSMVEGFSLLPTHLPPNNKAVRIGSKAYLPGVEEIFEVVNPSVTAYAVPPPLSGEARGVVSCEMGVLRGKVVLCCKNRWRNGKRQSLIAHC